MKTFLRSLLIGLLMVTLSMVTMAQTPEELEAIKKDLYEVKFQKNKSGTAEQKKIAADAAREFIRRFEKDEEVKPITDFLKGWLTKYDKQVAEDAIFTKFDASMTAKPINIADAFSSGKQILQIEPDNIDVMLVLAQLGFDEAVAKRDTYNTETLNYARTAIEKIEAGKPSGTGNYGAYKGFELRTTKIPDGKSNALAWMNMTIAFILQNRQNNPKEALPYFYKTTQYKNSELAKRTDALLPIAAWYRDEFNRLADELKAKYEAIKPELENEETKKMIAIQKGYAERAIDAYGRAYNLVRLGTDKNVTDNLRKLVEAFYKARFNSTTGVDAYLATVLAKPLPDPMTEVTPVIETTPPVTTPSTPTKPTKPTTGTSGTTATTVTPAEPKATPTGTKATPKPRKPAPKKKGTK